MPSRKIFAKNIIRLDSHLFSDSAGGVVANSAAFWTVWTFGARPALFKILLLANCAPQDVRQHSNRTLSPRQQFSCAMPDQRISPRHAGFITNPRRDHHHSYRSKCDSGLNKQFPLGRIDKTFLRKNRAFHACPDLSRIFLDLVPPAQELPERSFCFGDFLIKRFIVSALHEFLDFFPKTV